MFTPEEETKYQRELKSEERRALIWLGLLAVVVAFYFWLRSGSEGQPFYNLFCNYPCPHFTLYWIPFLEVLIYYWIAYAGCMLIYFSEDFFHKWGRKGRRFREFSRSLGHISISVYPASVLIISITGAISFLLPDWIQTPFWLLVGYFVVRLGVWFMEALTGRKNLTGRLAELSIEGAHALAELLVEGLLPILEKVAKRLLRGRTPPKLRHLWSEVKRRLEAL
jgi:hypothetical protein